MTTRPSFSTQELDDYEKFLLDHYELTQYERCKLAVEIQRNRMIADIFVLTENAPSVFEAIALALGYKK